MNSEHQQSSNLCRILTAQEVKILHLLVTGKTDQEIAQNLYVSERSVRQHLRRIYDKLGVNSRAAAAYQAGRLEVIDGSSQDIP